MSFRSSADGIAKKGKTKGKQVSMKGDSVGGPTGGAFKTMNSTMPSSGK